MEYSVVIVAAGKGSRMNLGYNKIYYKLNDRNTVIEETVNKFKNDKRCTQIIVVCDIQEFVEKVGLKENKLVLVKGGKSRQESVYNGLKAVINEVVLIHDGARPFVSNAILDRVVKTMESNDACCVMVKVKDTIKVVSDNVVVKTFDRESLRQAQTPQAFKINKLFPCYVKANKEGFIGTDDCSILEKYALDTRITEVEGDYDNIKITTIEDIR